MNKIQLPQNLQLSTWRLLDWTPKQKLEPNPGLLIKMRKSKRGQSEISRKRQQFITGTSNYHMTGSEVALKQEYMSEWHARIKENQW